MRVSLFLFYSAPVGRGTRTALACSFYPGGSSFLHRLCGGTRRAGGSPERMGRFSLRFSERDSPRPAARGKRVDTCGFYPLNSRFPLFLSLAHTRDRRPLRNRGTAEDFYYRVFLNLFAVSDSVLLHIRLNLRRRDIPVSRKSLVRCNARHL